MFFLFLLNKVPELFSEFERDIFSVMKFLIEFSFQFLIDSLIFLICHHERLELEKSDSTNQTELTWAKEFEK